jgi:hypothetical protein
VGKRWGCGLNGQKSSGWWNWRTRAHTG